MKVKVKLHHSAVNSVKGFLQKSGGEIPFFSRISLVALEPNCPFCNKRLHDLNCSCSSFQSAKQRLLSSYKREGLYVKYGFWPSYDFFIDQSICFEEVEAPENSILLFDEGTTFSKSDTEEWLVSVGLVEGNVLKFYLRQKGSEQFYSCEISHDCLSAKVDISNLEVFLAYSYRKTCKAIVNHGARVGIVGNYRFETREGHVAEFTLGTFLKKLTEI